MRRRTTTAVNGNCGRPPRIARSRVGSAQRGALICSPPFDPLLVRQHDEDAMRIRRSALFWTGKLSFSRVEQLPRIILAERKASVVHGSACGASDRPDIGEI